MAGFDINKYVKIIGDTIINSYEEIINDMSSEFVIVSCIILSP